MTVKPSPTARRTARQTSMSTAGSVGGWVLYAVQPAALKRPASSAYAPLEGSTADDAEGGPPVGYEPGSPGVGRPAGRAPGVPRAGGQGPPGNGAGWGG